MNQQNKNKLKDTKNRLMVAKGVESWELGEKGEGIKKYKWHLQNSHKNIQHSIRNIVKDTVMTMYNTR